MSNSKQPADQQQTFHYQHMLLISSLALIGIGLLMVASTSMVISDHQFGYPFHFLMHQVCYLLIAFVAAFVVMRIPLAVWQRCSGYILLTGLLLLILVLVPKIGHEINGSRRWLLIGPLSLQVSEVAKLAFIIYLAGYIIRQRENVHHRLIGFLNPMLLLGLFALLLLIEPDFGALAVIIGTVVGMLFLGGVPLRQFMVLMVVMTAMMLILAVSAPYRIHRLTAFLHPWENQFSSGYQLTQSLIAFGRGGIWGVGLGNSMQKLFYLPESHSDFLYAILAEELGLLGACAVILLFLVLIGCIFAVARRAALCGLEYGAFLSYGCGLWLGVQALINMGVNVGLLPTKGLTLPLMSSGGTSMIMNCIAVALALRTAYECQVYGQANEKSNNARTEQSSTSHTQLRYRKSS